MGKSVTPECCHSPYLINYQLSQTAYFIQTEAVRDIGNNLLIPPYSFLSRLWVRKTVVK